MTRPVVVAKVGAPHGVKGEVRVTSYLAEPATIGAYGPLTTPDGRTLTVVGARGHNDNVLVVRFHEIATREDAAALAGALLTVPRAALPATEDADTFYHADLIGLSAVTAEGAPLGVVAALYDFGGGDMIEVRGPGGSTLYPFTKAVVPEIDIAAGRLVVVPPTETEARGP